MSGIWSASVAKERLGKRAKAKEENEEKSKELCVRGSQVELFIQW